MYHPPHHHSRSCLTTIITCDNYPRVPQNRAPDSGEHLVGRFWSCTTKSIVGETREISPVTLFRLGGVTATFFGVPVLGSAYKDRPLLHVRHILDESFWEIWRNGQVDTGTGPDETRKAVCVVGRFRTKAAVFLGKKLQGPYPLHQSLLLHSSSHDACMHVLAVGALGLVIGRIPCITAMLLFACLIVGREQRRDRTISVSGLRH